MALHCKLCANGKRYKSIGELRKHQWAEHRERYAGTLKSLQSNGNGRAKQAPAGGPIRANPVPVPTLAEAIEYLESRIARETDVLQWLRSTWGGR